MPYLMIFICIIITVVIIIIIKKNQKSVTKPISRIDLVMQKYGFSEKDVEDIKQLKPLPKKSQTLSQTVHPRYEGMFRGKKINVTFNYPWLGAEIGQYSFNISSIHLGDKFIEGDEFTALRFLILEIHGAGKL